MNVPEIQDELLRAEYPFLLPDHDPDIERYYELRSNGRSQEAMGIFQSRLKVRYPNDTFRTLLMRSYRSRDPAYKMLLSRAYRALGERALERVKRIIVYIADKADSYNPQDVYSTIKTAEDILVFVPGDRYEATTGIERYLRYAMVLGLRERSMNMAAKLIRSYLNNSLDVVEEERRRRLVAQQQALRRERERLARADRVLWYRQQHARREGPLIDFSSVVFSPEDLARIEIPKSFVKVEDQTLAYCVKYWNLIEDTAFERILFLYSRKYGTKNYDILMTIRRGRQSRKRDDEILSSIMSSLATGYYYSIRGDRYLQERWNTIKETLKYSTGTKLRMVPPNPGQSATKAVSLKVASPKRAAKKARVPAESAQWKPPPAARPAAKAASAKEASLGSVPASAKPASLRPVPVEPPSVVIPAKAAPSQAASGKAAPSQPAPAKAAQPKSASLRRAAKKAQIPAAPDIPPGSGRTDAVLFPKKTGTAAKKEKGRLKAVNAAAMAEWPGGSVSDRLKKLSGRSYDVYQDRFLAKARPAIRKIMGAGRGLFFNLPEKAEDLIFNFLKGHYSDPYMNWEKSSEKAELQELGFELESLNPIIDECFRRL
ncbi:MAG: hypothetical protein LBD78_02900 [Spirochaetaceae bacterium]|jgi:hypothetical protein|nr:hypothetical protein [Spirochaetaceae bacterium]